MRIEPALRLYLIKTWTYPQPLRKLKVPRETQNWLPHKTRTNSCWRIGKLRNKKQLFKKIRGNIPQKKASWVLRSHLNLKCLSVMPKLLNTVVPQTLSTTRHRIKMKKYYNWQEKSKFQTLILMMSKHLWRRPSKLVLAIEIRTKEWKSNSSQICLKAHRNRQS